MILLFYFCVPSWLLHVIHNIRTFVFILPQQSMYIFLSIYFFCHFTWLLVVHSWFLWFIDIVWSSFCCSSDLHFVIRLWFVWISTFFYHPFNSLCIPHDFFVCLWFVWLLSTLVFVIRRSCDSWTNFVANPWFVQFFNMTLMSIIVSSYSARLSCCLVLFSVIARSDCSTHSVFIGFIGFKSLVQSWSLWSHHLL